MPDESNGTVASSAPMTDAPMPSPVVDSDSLASDTVVTPDKGDDKSNALATQAVPEADAEIPAEVARKIGELHNVLIALSSDPSVDELAAAIGLSIYLDRLGKRATAIYSGSTPNVLEFLKPEETFEPSADTLQDFVIAINKDKADHLRYRLDGDYVKIFITPYKTRVSENDLDYSYGDYNVDLVLALDVANGIDLDSALREHGRIMHDAVVINITTGNPGKFGEIEWSDKTASSVSEMIAKLLYGINGKIKIEKEEATAFLTGIVAATNRFSNAGTTPETMRVASRLMESGANQQLVAKNVTPDTDNQMFAVGGDGMDSMAITDLASEHKDGDLTKLDIQHGHEEDVDEAKEVSDTITDKESTLLDELKAAEEGLSQAGVETTPDVSNRPVRLDDLKDGDTGVNAGSEKAEVASEPSVETASTDDKSADNNSMESDLPPIALNEMGEPIVDGASAENGELTSTAAQEVSEALAGDGASGIGVSPVGNEVAATGDTQVVGGAPAVGGAPITDNASSVVGSEPVLPNVEEKIVSSPEKVLSPSSDFSFDSGDIGSDKYGKMLESALADLNAASASVPAPTEVGVSTGGEGTNGASIDASPSFGNPAASSAPTVPDNPEINGVPSINYMPMPGEEVLPPPPPPPIDMSASANPFENNTPNANPFGGPLSDNSSLAAGVPASPVDPALSIDPSAQPVPTGSMQDPAAFKIPGM